MSRGTISQNGKSRRLVFEPSSCDDAGSDDPSAEPHHESRCRPTRRSIAECVTREVDLNEKRDFEWSAEEFRSEYGWAIEIVRRHFATGLESICDMDFLNQRYEEFQRKHDPIYAELLDGMDDESLAKTFVSYWTIGQTIATQSRFWLEEAIAEIILYQVKRFNRPATYVYSQAMLGRKYFEDRKTIAEIGEIAPEHLTDRSPWRASVQVSALRAIDILVGEQEREPLHTES